MCYHTKQTKSAQEVSKRFQAIIQELELFQTATASNGFDFPKTPVITDDNPTIIQQYHWGLVPSWSKDEAIKKMTLNARIESLADKPAFSESVNKRCLILANGFYEWQWLDSKGKNKVKYEIGIGNEELFAFAGIYSAWTNKSTGEIKNTYAIVTTEANAVMAEIHNIKKRMPIILQPHDERNWLNHQSLQDFAYPYQVNLVAKKMDGTTPTLF